MVRVPPYVTPAALRSLGGGLGYRPGWRGSGAQPPPRPPLGAYTQRITGVPLQPGQQLGAIPASGTLTMSAGPSGAGNVWYPASVTLSTTTGAFDTSIAQVWAGSQGVPTTLLGTVYSGNGVVALALPPMTPGQAIIVTWTGATQGDTAAFNIVGTMDALTTGAAR